MGASPQTPSLAALDFSFNRLNYYQVFFEANPKKKIQKSLILLRKAVYFVHYNRYSKTLTLQIERSESRGLGACPHKINKEIPQIR